MAGGHKTILVWTQYHSSQVEKDRTLKSYTCHGHCSIIEMTSCARKYWIRHLLKLLKRKNTFYWQSRQSSITGYCLAQTHKWNCFQEEHNVNLWHEFKLVIQFLDLFHFVAVSKVHLEVVLIPVDWVCSQLCTPYNATLKKYTGCLQEMKSNASETN